MSQLGVRGWPRLAPALTHGGHLKLQVSLDLNGKCMRVYPFFRQVIMHVSNGVYAKEGREGEKEEGK